MTDHCCAVMTTQVNWHCDQHDTPSTCPDALIRFSARFQDEGWLAPPRQERGER
ncbi:DUF6980 family protein [Streptomyces sp. NPDC057644]|uniref:DUF6980 family protein n=1 Tax=Streptomyces sp. NPDC057644 TaxID=3346191 RepID=UPI00368D32A2